MLGSLTSLTGGGGLSSSSSASSANGDQGGGAFNVGPFRPVTGGGMTTQQLMIGGAFVLAAMGLYAISKKKR